jgi:hypothetical protein
MIVLRAFGMRRLVRRCASLMGMSIMCLDAPSAPMVIL